MSTEPSITRHILVVDDDDHTRNLLKELCEAAGYRVTQAEDGEQTLQTLRKEKPDLVLLDLMMPRRDGFSVLKEIRDTESMADLPVIILTAMGDMDGKIRGMELGADDYITKPFKLIELQTRINSALLVRQYRQRLSAAEEELAQFRAVDPVTGAGTYSQLKVSLESELSRARRYGRPAAALVFGFDDYQNLRYQLGREKCDELVAKMAQEVRGVLRGADRLFRLEVDEFVVLLPETDLAGCRIAADRLLQTIDKLSSEGQNGTVRLKARVGGAVFPGEQVKTSEDLLREAYRVYRTLRAGDKPLFDA